MTRGRKPTPTEIHRLNGTPGKRPLPADEPKPERGIPACPEHLDKEAQAEWHRVAKDLDNVGLLTFVDRAALAAYCTLWSQVSEGELALEKDGHVLTDSRGKRYKNPWVSIVHTGLVLLRSFAAEFGMTPSARTRVKGIPKEEKSKLAAFIEDAS